MPLSVSQMARLSPLLEEALSLDEAGRRRWLAALPQEHEDLLPALKDALLPPGGRSSGIEALATLPKFESDDETGAASSRLRPGDRVGPYRLERALGAGGMAEVWLAQRADGAFKREVALKLPMLSKSRQDLPSRFARERDILAGLEHPNIARLYDAGVTPEGLPYLAMEYVHGEPFTAWCDRHRLGIRERLKLFLQVLEAVQYAHDRQVIHRDIKPSNILVSDSGQVRLLDFGVAKLLAEDEERTELTQLYGRALTPEYAAPELIRGEPIDAVSDIYALGVVLYELLAGSRPYRIQAASLAALGQAVVTVQIERPSTQLGAEAGADRGTTQDQLARKLRGDLDAIVLKALAKVPERRYRSAQALADDLHLYLSGEPVKARPDTLLYRTSKFVLRHRAGVAASGAAGLVIAVLGGYALTHRPQAMPSPEVSEAAHPTPVPPTPVPDDKSVAVLPFAGRVQQTGKIHTIGYLSAGSASSSLREVFPTALRELGWIEGKNVVIERRYAENRLERLPNLAAELVRLNVDVIVTVGTLAPLAAKRATPTIPIAMAAAGDPLGSGLVDSLARPGGNVTGTSLMAPDLAGKRLELLKEVLPRLARVAVLWNAANPYSALVFKGVRDAGLTLGIEVQSVEVRGPDDFEGAFETVRRRHPDALMTVEDPLTFTYQKVIADFALRQLLPTLYGIREGVVAGALMSYGPNLVDLYRRTAGYVDKILKGVRPADLPVQQPTKFELVINLKTAKTLGLTVPPSLIARADEVIQ